VPGGAVGFKHIKTRETAEDCREKGKGDATGHRMVDQTDSARWRWFWEALGDWDLSSSQNYRNTGTVPKRGSGLGKQAVGQQLQFQPNRPISGKQRGRGSKYAYKFWGIVWKRKERKCRRMEVRGKVERMHGNQRKKGGRVCSKLKITEAYITSSGTGVNLA